MANLVLDTFYWAVNLLRAKFRWDRSFILPRRFYTDTKLFELERTRIFENLWIFAGLTNELGSTNSWMVKRIGNKEIIITRNNDSYFANENVCPHKNMRLMNSPAGRGPLVCSYHAWSFNLDGSNAKIPHSDRSYLFTKEQEDRSCLRQYSVERVGNFLFVNLSKHPRPLQQQFDKYILKSLKLLSHRLSNEYASMREVRSFNWKLNFENLRDALHPEIVHSKTLAKGVEFSEQHKQMVPLKKMLKWIKLAEASSFSKDGEQKSNTKGHADHLIKPSFGEGYYNWLLFPNFHMASPDGGRSYLIEVHNPIAPDRTEITHYVICSKPNQPNDMFLDEFIEHRLRGLHKVLEEDYEVCENVQKAIEFTSLEQNIGAYEYYNVNIASLYRILMKR